MRWLILACGVTGMAFMSPAGAKLPIHARPRAVAKPVALAETPELQQLRRAFQYAFPVYEMMRTRAGVVAKAQVAGLSGVNRLFARKTLADATTREVTTPNNDTLYATAWLDLANGPVTLTVPDLGERYNSAALMNVFSDNVAVLGTSSGGGGQYTIVGPGWVGKAPEAGTLVRATSNDAWLLVRVYVNGTGDLPAAGEAIDKFALTSGGAPVPTKTVPSATPDARTFLAVVDEALGRSNIGGRVGDFAAQGIRPGAVNAFAALPPATQQLWTAALPKFRKELQAGLAKAGTVAGGWSTPQAGIGEYGGSNDVARAAVALGGLGALPRREAVYYTATTDADGQPLDGSKHAYTMHIPPKPPAAAFWSLTMYTVEPDGRLFFFANSLNRFSIGSGLRSTHYERDASLDIFVQTGKPSGERVVNWLPAPPGPFRLVWRAYLPRPELLDGSFKLPPVAVTEAVE
jgi:hypothetical protein